MDALSADPYPQICPFCRIAEAYPGSGKGSRLQDSIPLNPEPEKLDPSCFLVLSSHRVMAFLDIMPLAKGHLLVASRQHKPKLADLDLSEGEDIGFWLPLLSRALMRVTGVEDYNIVQNNGIAAAQVVPHVHFHMIPRPARLEQLENKSWTMFGRGQRTDLDEDEARLFAQSVREELAKAVGSLDREKAMERL